MKFNLGLRVCAGRLQTPRGWRCPLLALNGHPTALSRCPLLGE